MCAQRDSENQVKIDCVNAEICFSDGRCLYENENCIYGIYEQFELIYWLSLEDLNLTLWARLWDSDYFLRMPPSTSTVHRFKNA